MIRNVHHIACATGSIEEGYRFWRDVVGLRVKREAELPEQGVLAALLALGNTEIELIQPMRQDTGVARFLERSGSGMHHVCFETDDVEGELAGLKERGVELIDSRVRRGLAGEIFFVHPRATQSVLVEFAQPDEATHPGALEDALFADVPLVCTITGDLLGSARQWEQNFGLRVESYSVSEVLDNRHVMIPAGPKGSVSVEVMTPLSADGKNAEFLRNRGDGLFLLATRTRDLPEAARRLRDAGIRITGEPADGVVFVHPKSTGGVFIELLPFGPVH